MTGVETTSCGALSFSAISFFLLAVCSVSARVCILGTEPDESTGGRVRFVLPPGDPCSCTRITLGGHNTYAPQREDAPIYIDNLPNDAAGLGRLFGCMDKKTDMAEGNSQGVTQPYLDCQDIRNAGNTSSGVYSLNYTTIPGLQVYCDMETANSGFIVIQRRHDGSVYFNRSWAEYQDGFGDLRGEFWWGNQKLRNLTDTEVTTWELVVDLEAFDGETGRVRYGNFSVTGDLYDLTVDDFEADSDEGDCLVRKQRAFSTFDMDNDESGPSNCASKFKGGWWYDKCKDYVESNLNGKYYFNQTQSVDEGRGKSGGSSDGVIWETWRGKDHSLKGCQMKIRRNK